MSAAFDLIKARIAELDDGDTASSAGRSMRLAPSPSSAAPDGMAAAAVETVQETSAASGLEAAMGMPAEAVVATAEAVEGDSRSR